MSKISFGSKSCSKSIIKSLFLTHIWMPKVHSTVGMRKETALYNEASYLATPAGIENVSQSYDMQYSLYCMGPCLSLYNVFCCSLSCVLQSYMLPAIYQIKTDIIKIKRLKIAVQSVYQSDHRILDEFNGSHLPIRFLSKSGMF